MQKILSVVDLLCRNQLRRFAVILSTYEIYFEAGILNKILYEDENNDWPQ
jgi:hypothetical protein